jgi:hypothetical protein
VTLHWRSQRHDLAPPPDSLVAATSWCRWWWVGAGTALTVYADGAGVLTWTVGSPDGPQTWRARAVVDIRTVAAIERELESMGLRPPGTGRG